MYGKDLKVTEYLLGDDSINDMIDEYDIIDTNIICDYCVIPEADNILKGLTS